MKTSIPRNWLRQVLTGIAPLLLPFSAYAATPPSIVAVVIKDGAIEAGKWEWVRGGLAGASEEDRRSWAAVEEWLAVCEREDRAAAVAELQSLGIAKPSLPEPVHATLACAQAVALSSAVKPGIGWTEFSARMAEAKTVIGQYLFGAQTAISQGTYDPTWLPPYGWEIVRATMRDQALRKGFSWNVRADSPKLDEALLPYLRAQLSALTAAEDRANSEMLKAIVAEHGWPGKTKVGQRVAANAWLLVQHADHDPAFQLKVLRLMEPMTATEEVSRSNYAYLYDRIMLKLVGTQRYGTQFGACQAGARPLRSLEAGRDLAGDRAAMGLEPIELYRQQMDKAFGPCPK